MLIVGAAVGQSPDTSITTTATYGGTSMTSVGKLHVGGLTAGYCEMFSLLNPAAGTNTVLITASAAINSMEAGSISFTGAGSLGTAVTAATNNVTSQAAVVPTTTGGMVVDMFAWGSGGVATSTQTQRWQKALNGNTAAGDGAQSTAASTGGNVTMSYSWGALDAGGIIAVEIRPTAVSLEKRTPANRARFRAATW